QSFLHPREDRPVRFHVNQAARARDRGVIGRGAVEAKAHEAAYGQRIRRAPGDAALRVEPFEVSDQQQTKVSSRWPTRSAHHRSVELLTLLRGEPVEAGVVEGSVQSGVERMARRRRQISRSYPHRGLLARSFAHRHGPHFTFTPSRLTRDFSRTFT